VRYNCRSDGGRVLEPKDDSKKRFGRSPDLGDALALAWRTTRARLVRGPAPRRTVAEIHDGRQGQPKDTDHAGCAPWEREHRFDGVVPRGNPFKERGWS
jgi:hypothetical protein